MIAAAPRIELLPDRPEICYVVPGFFSPRLCRNFMSSRIKAGFRGAHTHYPTYYRTNERQVVDDHRLAADLFRRFREHAPETIGNDSSPGGADTEEQGETWRLHSLNERLRLCRYLPGQFFGRHLDGVHHRTRELQSRLTFMIYLNDASEFRGGRTLFYESRNAARVLAEYHPRAGDLIIFDHKLWHEGERVDAGEKYILRSDILYERIASPDGSPRGSAVHVDNRPFTPGHLGYIWKLLRLANGDFLSGGRDREIKIWAPDGRSRGGLREHSHSVLALEELDEDDFASGSRDGKVIIWKRNTAGDYRAARTINRHRGTVTALRRLFPDHRGTSRFASGGSDASIFVHNFAGDLLTELKGHEDWVWDMLPLSPHRLLSVSQDGKLGLWDLERGRPAKFFGQADAPLNALAMTSVKDANDMSRILYTGDGRGRIHIWNCPDSAGAEIFHGDTFAAHDGVIRALTPLGSWGLASGGEDNRVRVWTRQGRLLEEFSQPDFTQSLVYHEGVLYSAGYDGEIRTRRLNLPPIPECP